MAIKFKHITHQALGADFYVAKATKHHSIANNTQTQISCIQPGDYVVFDKHFNPMVFDRPLFKKTFGHKILQELDEMMEEA